MTQPDGLSTEVALKVLRRDLPTGNQAVQRLQDEARLLSALQHPVILAVHDLTELSGRVCLITEYIDGQDLSGCMRGPEGLGVRALLQVIGQVAAALHAAYEAPHPRGGKLRIVHRDVKPSNIRIGRNGDVKLLDFGIARTDELTREAETGTGMMVGSPAYMAPERFVHNEPLPGSDVFSLGVILWEGLAGQRLFSQPLTVRAAQAIDAKRYSSFTKERLQQVTHRAPREVLALVRHLVAFDPEQRPHAEALAGVCEALADELGGDTLSTWVRARSWPAEPARDPGELDGLTLVEGEDREPPPDLNATAPAQSPVMMAAPSDARRRSTSGTQPLGLLVGGASVTMLLVGLLAAVLGLLAVGVTVAPQWFAPVVAEAPRDDVQPGPSTPPAPQPAPSPVADPAPKPPAPASVVPPAKPSVRDPVPSRPVAAAPVAATGVIGNDGDAPFELLQSGVVAFTLAPTERRSIPAGTWEVRPTWPGRHGGLSAVEVPVGGEVRIRCTSRMGNCARLTP